MELASAPTLIGYVVNYGLGVVLAVFMAIFLGFILKFVLKENAAREERLCALLDGNVSHLRDDLKKHDERVTRNIDKLEEANKYQREEHQKMIEVLNRLLVCAAKLNGPKPSS